MSSFIFLGGYTMKKFICIVLTVVLTLSCMSAFAAEPLSSQEGGTTTQESITPFWVNTLSIIPSISGSAGTYSCSINGVSGTTKISATLVLYEKGLSFFRSRCYLLGLHISLLPGDFPIGFRPIGLIR